jgi:hypothetical protein
LTDSKKAAKERRIKAIQQLVVPPGTGEICEMLIDQGFDVDGAKSVLWDLTSGEIVFKDQEAKNVFVRERIAAHDRIQGKPTEGEDDDDSVDESDPLQFFLNDSASEVLPVTERATPRYNLRSMALKSPPQARRGMLPPKSAPKPTPVPPESTVLEPGQGEILNDRTVQPGVDLQECGPAISAWMKMGFSFEEGMKVWEANQRIKFDQIESSARAEASQIQAYRDMSVDQINAISRNKYINANPEVAIHLFGLTPGGDGQQDPSWTLSQESAVEPMHAASLGILGDNQTCDPHCAHPHVPIVTGPKRKRYPTFVEWVDKNMARSYMRNGISCTPVVVQAVKIIDIPAQFLFALNQLAFRFKGDPQLERYHMTEMGSFVTFEEGGHKVIYSSFPLPRHCLQQLVNLAKGSPNATSLPSGVSDEGLVNREHGHHNRPSEVALVDLLQVPDE